MPYFIAPFVGWLASGCIKFAIHFMKYGKDASQHMGNGGFPSTHTATVSSVAFLIGFGEGWLSPVFGLAAGVLFIVIIDATGLRIAVGKQAAAVNKMNVDAADYQPLRERMGHTIVEILGGLGVGLLVSVLLFGLFTWWGWV
ncbi:divergent PAP2 family protein [Virgibacillus halodenitrificans]|uniref:divergent PAP2 family protein n=1 Tax=Virgibacillus halodenitrificans TaxID=1482 RepID=UPI000EF4CFCE|nr:divergent PAP2 family protein [Virgibacillus halodenitrificans]MCG1027005.1 divergent PAP2 family protein [Virgibacillus halodenitrificans]